MIKIELLDYLLKVSAGTAAFYLLYSLLLQRDTFFNRNRFYLLGASFASLVIPLINFSQYPEAVIPQTYQEPLRLIPQSVGQVQQQFEGHILLTDYLFYLYFAGVLFFAGLFVHKLTRLIRLIRAGKQEKHTGYIVIATEGSLPIFSFFNYLFWDTTQTLSPEEEEQILQHELTHIQEKHTWDSMYLQLLQILLWFNPVIYLYKKALQAQHEFIADRNVTRKFSKELYSYLLARNFLSKFLFPLSHSFNQNFIKNRISMMNNKSSGKEGLLKLTLVLPLVAILLFAFTPEVSRQTMRPDAIIMLSDTIPEPALVPFAVSKSYSGGYKQINLQEGIKVSQLPEAIHVRSEAEPGFAEKFPKEANYRVFEFKINLIRGKRVYYTKNNKGEASTDRTTISLNEVRSSIEAGDRILIEVVEVQRMSSKGQISTVNMAPGQNMLNIAITQ